MKTKARPSLYRKPYWVIAFLSIFVLVLAACAPAATPEPTAAPTSMPPTAAPTATIAPTAAIPVTGGEAVINVATDAKLGKILVGANGMTLYMYAKDEANKSNCAGNCLKAWPPLLTQGKPNLGDGVDASLVGSSALPDGTMIVTYNKMPLYYYVKDTKAGDVTGQGVGSVWYVVSPAGKAIGREPSITVYNDPKLGNILVGDNGMTLYMYTKDAPDKVNCAGNCLKAWPPLLTSGKPVLGPGVDASLIGTADVGDGTTIVTYNHMPLYYWAKDTKAGDVTGQGVGNVWYVVSPDGKPVGMQAAATATPAASSNEPTISVVTDAKFGKILVGDKGMTLYMYTKDAPDQSNCSANCLKAWPPLLTMGKPILGPGVDASLVGTSKLADGTLIVTYNHMPLYYFAKDAKAGDVTGQGVGSVWYVVSPDGKSVTQAQSTTKSDTGY